GVQALLLPIAGRVGPGAAFAFGTSCAVVSFNMLQTGGLQLGPTRLPVCPTGPAIIYKGPSGAVVTSGRVNRPVLDGRLGTSPLHVQAAQGQFSGSQFTLNSLAARLGQTTSPVLVNAT